MAECFCGCGRKVGFATKKASKFGQTTTDLLEQLNAAAEKSDVSLSQRQQEIIGELRAEGPQLIAFWQNVAHGGSPASTADAVKARRHFHGWEKDTEAAIRVLTGVSRPA